MPFGRYRSWLVAELPADYLSWLGGLKDLREPLASAVHQEAKRRDVISEPQSEHVRVAVAEALIGAGVRSLARKYHPDAGGSHQAMVCVNDAADWLRRQLRSLS
jgi:hypothetical protein